MSISKFQRCGSVAAWQRGNVAANKITVNVPSWQCGWEAAKYNLTHFFIGVSKNYNIGVILGGCLGLLEPGLLRFF